MSVGEVAFLVVAGVAAGLSGSIAGLASLFSYPALLAVGLPATAANMTNTVALTVNGFGSAAGSRVELAGQGATLRRLALVVGLGGALGAGLLLLTPPRAFERIVPFLVGGASVALLAQPRISAAVDGRHGGVGVALLGVSVYAGYFGAAAGVLLLALLLLVLPVTLLEGNALKNVLLAVSNGVAACAFAIFGSVDWAAAVTLAVGVVVGSYAGPAVARRLPARGLQVGIALAGLGLAVKLGLDAF